MRTKRFLDFQTSGHSVLNATPVTDAHGLVMIVNLLPGRPILIDGCGYPRAVPKRLSLRFNATRPHKNLFHRTALRA